MTSCGQEDHKLIENYDGMFIDKFNCRKNSHLTNQVWIFLENSILKLIVSGKPLFD
jgi:hypothetical protein